jgi:hypothetical protein
MARELRTTLVIMAAVLLMSAPLIFADAPATQSNYNYLAAVFHVVPTPTPTPVPTPVPPDISTLVIQLSEMKSGYVREDWREVTNAQAASTYHDPKAAAAAFKAQGREISWYAAYSSRDYVFSDAVGVSSQVYRFLTPAGAGDGMAYIVAEVMRDHPDFRPFNLGAPDCCPTIALRRTFKSGTTNIDHFLIISQVGRYVTETEPIGVLGSLTISRAIYYAQLALNHLTPVPQVISE